jgi:hypothetical protein
MKTPNKSTIKENLKNNEPKNKNIKKKINFEEKQINSESVSSEKPDILKSGQKEVKKQENELSESDSLDDVFGNAKTLEEISDELDKENDENKTFNKQDTKFNQNFQKNFTKFYTKKG